MCGIVGYIGDPGRSLELTVNGLKLLEYRGYDSAGVAVKDAEQVTVVKTIGKISALEEKLKGQKLSGSICIGHTRWATHGVPSTENSHPHQDDARQITLVHNGIIENFTTLKIKLEEEGIVFRSETDTEVLAQLIGLYYRQDGPLEEAVSLALQNVEGAYAIAVISAKENGKIVVAKNSSPLCVGLGKNEVFLASDAIPFIKYTNKAVYLQDQQVGIITKEGLKLRNLSGKEVSYETKELSLNPEDIDKGEFEHYMLKEIFEQPRAIQDTIDGRISAANDEVIFKELEEHREYLANVKRIIIAACGTSWHAGLDGEYFLEKYARIPVEVEYAAEFRYRDPILDEKTLVITISQSGETADTLAAIGEAQSCGAKVLSIVNVPNSTIDRDSDIVLYTYAGREIGVASTKAFTTQIVVLLLFSIYMGQLRHAITEEKTIAMLDRLRKIPNQITKIFSQIEHIKDLAKKMAKRHNVLYLGRGVGYPIALEGALKLKEISYIHAEGYPAAEMKHGPIALIDENMPTVVLAFRGRRYEKVMSNIMEIKARGGKVIAIATEGNKDIHQKLKHIIEIPETSESLSTILAVIPLQLLAYYIAVEKGCSVDQPRNLAKSVTVE